MNSLVFLSAFLTISFLPMNSRERVQGEKDVWEGMGMTETAWLKWTLFMRVAAVLCPIINVVDNKLDGGSGMDVERRGPLSASSIASDDEDEDEEHDTVKDSSSCSDECRISSANLSGSTYRINAISISSCKLFRRRRTGLTCLCARIFWEMDEFINLVS